MSHGIHLNIDIDAAIEAEPLQATGGFMKMLWLLVGVGALTFILGLVFCEPEYFWGAYYVNLVFWMGLAAGSVMTTAIFQIVRAKWAPPVRRIAESSIAFLPWAYVLFLITYFGKETLFPWGGPDHDMPGREYWMQDNFVYIRFALLLGGLFYLMYIFVRASIRSDLGMVREKLTDSSRYHGWFHDAIAANWKGKEEVLSLQRFMSRMAPFLVFVYVVVYSLFAFELIMGMDTIWFSNMFGGWNFVGNIYVGWAMTALFVMYFASNNSDYAKTVTTQQLWDLGKLMLGFSMLWAYMFLSQYLPQWYGNLPEETQWLLLRVRGLWMPVSYTVLAMCFIMPFIWLLSEDIKKTPRYFSIVCIVVLLGYWLEKYVVIMPQLSPEAIPLANGGLLEIGFFLGFGSIYLLSVLSFLSSLPMIPVSHPVTEGNIDW